MLSQAPHLDQHRSTRGSFWDILENPLNVVNYKWTKISASLPHLFKLILYRLLSHSQVNGNKQISAVSRKLCLRVLRGNEFWSRFIDREAS